MHGGHETFVVTVDGSPAFYLAPIFYDDDDDFMSRLIETNSEFRQMLEERRDGRYISSEELSARLEADAAEDAAQEAAWRAIHGPDAVRYESMITLDEAKKHLREYGELCNQGEIDVVGDNGLEFRIVPLEKDQSRPAETNQMLGTNGNGRPDSRPEGVPVRHPLTHS